MVRITVELVRKRSEHNEGEISTLEELSLHQEDLEKIEHLQNWCRGLKILYLQSNLISKIENLHKMKRLEYLNMALNNVERVENLEGCESLQKLDLTLNFIGELTTIDSLKGNLHLQSLFLTGNPCADYPGYRDYVIATLPQLKTLDSEPIERSHRIKALQNYKQVQEYILEEQEKHKVKREKQKQEYWARQQNTEESLQSSDDVKRYWNELCDNSPETRVELAKQSRKLKEEKTKHVECGYTAPKKISRLFKEDGRPLSINEPRIPFTLEEDDDANCLVLTIQVYKYLDTSLVSADVQPNYVRVEVKKKIFQMVLPESVHPDRSLAKRSQTTGHLVITMPMVKDIKEKKTTLQRPQPSTPNVVPPPNMIHNKRQLLEIGGIDKSLDFSRIVEMPSKPAGKPKLLRERVHLGKVCEKSVSNNFEENYEVPPLE